MIESYLCETNSVSATTGKPTQIILDALRIKKKERNKIKDRLLQLNHLDPNIVETPYGDYYSANYVYVADKKCDEGKHNLSYLKRTRSPFSDADLGEIAYQLLK